MTSLLKAAEHLVTPALSSAQNSTLNRRQQSCIKWQCCEQCRLIAKKYSTIQGA
jgi:hypothetical protein